MCRENTVMETVTWHYDSRLHMLVADGACGAKAYFILTLIEAQLKEGTQFTIRAPKNADLTNLADIMSRVYSKKEATLVALGTFSQNIIMRNDQIKQTNGFKTGENYVYLALPSSNLP